MNRIDRKFECSLRRACAWVTDLFILFFLFLPILKAQVPEAAPEAERPIPILTGNAGYFTNVNGGEAELVPSITPVLLVPLGNRWLVESRAEFKGEFERTGLGRTLRRESGAGDRLPADGLHRQPLPDGYGGAISDPLWHL